MAASHGTWSYDDRKRYEPTWKLGGVLEPRATSQQNASAGQWGEKHYAVDSNDIARDLFGSRPSKTAESWAAWSSSRSLARLQNRHEPIDGRGNFVTAPCHLHHAEDLFRE